MTTMRRTFQSVAVVAIAGLALSACSLGVGGPGGAGNVENSGGTGAASEGSHSGEQKDSSKNEGGDASKENAAGDGGANTVKKPSQVLATWEGTLSEGKSARFDINEVLISDGMTRLTFTVTNTGQTEWEEGGNLRRLLRDEIRLVDPKNHLLYRPGQTDDMECLCTNLSSWPAVPSGESVTLYTTFKALPEGVDTVSVNIEGVTQAFENVKVTRK